VHGSTAAACHCGPLAAPRCCSVVHTMDAAGQAARASAAGVRPFCALRKVRRLAELWTLHVEGVDGCGQVAH